MMKKFSLALMLSLLAPLAAQAEFRCPKSGKIVHEGENQFEVEQKCGRPSSKVPLQSVTQGRRGRSSISSGEEWTYDFGPSYFVQKLTFDGGTLSQITQGDHGTTNPNAKAPKRENESEGGEKTEGKGRFRR